jgi:hypothetical protein
MPARPIRRATVRQAQSLDFAIAKLKDALASAKNADCPSLCRKIRSAIKSAGGAARHMSHRLSRTRPDGTTRHWRENL